LAALESSAASTTKVRVEVLLGLWVVVGLIVLFPRRRPAVVDGEDGGGVLFRGRVDESRAQRLSACREARPVRDAARRQCARPLTGRRLPPEALRQQPQTVAARTPRLAVDDAEDDDEEEDDQPDYDSSPGGLDATFVVDAADDPNAAKRFWFEHATGSGKSVAALGFVEASERAAC